MKSYRLFSEVALVWIALENLDRFESKFFGITSLPEIPKGPVRSPLILSGAIERFEKDKTRQEGDRRTTPETVNKRGTEAVVEKTAVEIAIGIWQAEWGRE